MKLLKPMPSILLLICVLVTGCGIKEVAPGPKIEISSYAEEHLAVMRSPEFYITCDSAKLEVYTWDRNEAKFEIKKKLRGTEKKEVLEEYLKNFVVNIEEDGNKVYIDSFYRGKIKSPADMQVEFTVHIPKNTSVLDFDIDIGNVRVLDDIKCTLIANYRMVNMEINRFVGKLDIQSDMGNVRIGEGKILSGSSIVQNMGNINVKGEYERAGSCTYQTNMGNIEIIVPDGFPVSAECIGTVETNEFNEVDHPFQLHIKSSMGMISVRKN